MNVDKILNLANVIERAGEDGKRGFCMSTYSSIDRGAADHSGHNCGTVACIAGWLYAIEVADGEITERANFQAFGTAMRSLELDEHVAAALFTPMGDMFHYGTSTQAARVLRILAATGQVMWHEVYYDTVPNSVNERVTKFLTERELLSA